MYKLKNTGAFYLQTNPQGNYWPIIK